MDISPFAPVLGDPLDTKEGQRCKRWPSCVGLVPSDDHWHQEMDSALERLKAEPCVDAGSLYQNWTFQVSPALTAPAPELEGA